MLQPKTLTTTETTASTTPKVLIMMVFVFDKQVNLQLLMLVEEKIYQEFQTFFIKSLEINSTKPTLYQRGFI